MQVNSQYIPEHRFYRHDIESPARFTFYYELSHSNLLQERNQLYVLIAASERLITLVSNDNGTGVAYKKLVHGLLIRKQALALIDDILLEVESSCS